MKKSQSSDLKQSKDQFDRFLETARALGCDESEAGFDEKLKVIARRKPKDEPKPMKPPRLLE